MDKSAMSRVVDDLVKKGCIRREQDPRDRRYVVIELTETGNNIYQHIEESSLRQFSKLVAALPENERQSVVSGLTALNKAMASSLLITECSSSSQK
jgi:DNA-binding MarR family transcriptional regulator